MCLSKENPPGHARYLKLFPTIGKFRRASSMKSMLPNTANQCFLCKQTFTLVEISHKSILTKTSTTSVWRYGGKHLTNLRGRRKKKDPFFHSFCISCYTLQLSAFRSTAVHLIYQTKLQVQLLNPTNACGILKAPQCKCLQALWNRLVYNISKESAQAHIHPSFHHTNYQWTQTENSGCLTSFSETD